MFKTNCLLIFLSDTSIFNIAVFILTYREEYKFFKIKIAYGFSIWSQVINSKLSSLNIFRKTTLGEILFYFYCFKLYRHRLL